MAQNTVRVKMPDQRGRPGPTWKINRQDAARIQELVDAGGVVIGAYEVEAAAESHSDQDIGQANALLDVLPELTEAQAKAIVAAGYTLATLPKDVDELTEIKGIGDATAEKIVEALN